jgi:hypothetical protein
VQDGQSEQSASPDQSLDQQIADLLGPQRTEREAFDKFSSELQGQLGPNVPDDYAKTQLLAMSVENPAIEAAWRFRNLTATERAIAERDFNALEVLYHKALQAPDDPRKAQALAQMERKGQELGLMMNAQKILTRAYRDVQKRAAKVQPAIDLEATADRALVAQSVRDGRMPLDYKEPEIEWGKLSSVEGRREVKERFGFDPGWGH